MKRTLLVTLTALILVILPFLVGNAISKYSPYIETNSFMTYVIIWAVISIAFTLIVAVLLKYSSQSFGSILVGGPSLFLLLCPIVGIIGLAAAPDLSLIMLQHPEREHLRYIFLFIAAILFGIFFIFLLKSDSSKIGKTTRWIMTVVFILAFAEFIWEFTHHYLYPEALKEWISQGRNAEEFGKNYDNINIINIGVFGRLIQFALIIWVSLHLYKLQQIKIWSPIITITLSLVGIVSATVIYITHMNIPKGFEILFLFFIPGIPFLLLYWLGVALLTKFKKSEVVI
jgi:MFS family permease